MTAALPVHVALVDDTNTVGMGDMARIAGAINEQIQRDFAPIWKVKASVGAYPPKAVPPGCWSVHVQQQLDQPGALGYHSDENNQPVAYVELMNDVSITISHEVLEMLADPFGNRMHGARQPGGITPEQLGTSANVGTDVMVNYLLEVCDPPENVSYAIGGIKVSDFLWHNWYFDVPGKQTSFSHAGGCNQPREIANGGYVSFCTHDGTWWQVFNNNGLQLQNIGTFAKGSHSSLREFTDTKAREYRAGQA